jgi:hypothetical protein
MKKQYDGNLSFCCLDFKRELELHNLTGPNIRIVRVESSKISISKNSHNMFYLTVGYEEGDVNVPRRILNHCPFCGEQLRNFYSSEDYVNELNHSFMKFS